MPTQNLNTTHKHGNKILTTLDFPVISKYYYVVNFKNPLNPKLIPVYFLNRKLAKKAIKANITNRKKVKFYKVFKGKQIRSNLFPYALSSGKWGKRLKYTYPSDRISDKDRKNYRTLLRRRLRRMGLYTIVKPKQGIRQEPQSIRLIKNTQKISDTKNTLAQVIQIQRKPESIYYLVLKKLKPKRRGVLMRLKVVKLRKVKGVFEYKVMKISILKTDILIPHLLTDLWRLIGNESLINTLKTIQHANHKKKAPSTSNTTRPIR